MEIKEFKSGIKRIYVNEIDMKELGGKPGLSKCPFLQKYLQEKFNLRVKKILDIVMCEDRFGYHIYYI